LNSFDANEERCEHKVAYYVCDGGYHAWQELVAPYKNQIDDARYSRWSANMESVRKDVVCTFGILKKRFLIFEQSHSAACSRSTFISYCVIHNWLHLHDGWDDWQERRVVSEEDVAVEYDVLDQNNIYYGKESQYHGFDGNFTLMQIRKSNPRLYYLDEDENSDCVALLWKKLENHRLSLIQHYMTMVKNHTLNYRLH